MKFNHLLVMVSFPSATVNIALPGSYTNTYTVTDVFGNRAQTDRVVTVLLPPQPVCAPAAPCRRPASSSRKPPARRG